MKYDNLLAEYLKGSDVISDKVRNLSNDLLLFKPSIDDAWSIKEHVLHLVDSEINNFIRWKSILAQPNSRCFIIEENTWTKKLNYEREDMQKYLQVFKLLRAITCDYLNMVNENEWNKNYFIHEYEGKINKVTLENIIEVYKNHVYFHTGYIDRNIKLFGNP